MEEFKDWTLYNKDEYLSLSDLDFKNYSKKGYVYILECGDKIKIGTTKEPAKRIASIKSMGENYANFSTGLVLVSKAHYNRVENEKLLHTIFSDNRIGKGEMFSLTLNEAIEKILKTDMNFVIKNDEQTVQPEDIVRAFHGDIYHLPKSNGKKTNLYSIAPFICFSEKFDYVASELFINYGIKKEEIVKELYNFLSKKIDIKYFENVYKENFNEEADLLELCECFKEIRNEADEYLDNKRIDCINGLRDISKWI